MVTGKSQTVASPYWLSDSEVNTVGRGLRFSRNDRTVEVIKLFIVWHTKIKQKSKVNAAAVITLRPIVRAQSRNRPVSITGE